MSASEYFRSCRADSPRSDARLCPRAGDTPARLSQARCSPQAGRGSLPSPRPEAGAGQPGVGSERAPCSPARLPLPHRRQDAPPGAGARPFPRHCHSCPRLRQSDQEHERASPGAERPAPAPAPPAATPKPRPRSSVLCEPRRHLQSGGVTDGPCVLGRLGSSDEPMPARCSRTGPGFPSVTATATDPHPRGSGGRPVSARPSRDVSLGRAENNALRLKVPV